MSDQFSVDFIADDYVRSMQAQIAGFNSRATAAYDLTWDSAKQNLDITGTWTAPMPVTVQSVDPVKLRALFLDWSASLRSGFKPLDTTTAMTTHTYSKSAPSTAAPAPLPQPASPVGFDMGNGYWSVVPGDKFPAGHVEIDARGVFVKVSFVTPFGLEVAYRQAQ